MGKSSTVSVARRSLPKIDSMLEWGVVKEGDISLQREEKMNALS